MSEIADGEQAPEEPGGFAVTVSGPEEGVITVAVTGAVDLLTAPPVGRALERAQQVASAVRLDLRQVDFLGSAGLSVLVDAARRAGESGGRLAVLSDQHAVLRAVQVTGLDEVLSIFGEPDGATAYLRS